MLTDRGFVVPDSIMKKSQEEFTAKIQESFTKLYIISAVREEKPGNEDISKSILVFFPLEEKVSCDDISTFAKKMNEL